MRSVSSADADLDTYRPDDPLDAGVTVRFLVGPHDGPGEESFDVVLCTPRWLSGRVQVTGPLLVRHHVVMEPFDLRLGVEQVTRLMQSVSADDWAGVGEKLARIGQWEFEDYT